MAIRKPLRSVAARMPIRMHRGSLQSTIFRRRFETRLQFIRPGSGVMHGRRGGFFGSVFKGIKSVVTTVAKLPVVSTVAKVALSSLPVVKAATTAVGAVKKLTASGATGSVIQASSTGAQGIFSAVPFPSLAASKPKRKRKAKAKRATKRKAKRKAKGKRKAGGTAKQRAARARFARAAKKGRIKKGSHLR